MLPESTAHGRYDTSVWGISYQAMAMAMACTHANYPSKRWGLKYDYNMISLLCMSVNYSILSFRLPPHLRNDNDQRQLLCGLNWLVSGYEARAVLACSYVCVWLHIYDELVHIFSSLIDTAHSVQLLQAQNV